MNIKLLSLLILFSVYCFGQGKTKSIPKNVADKYKMKTIHIKTRWANKINYKTPLDKYPRPQFKRKNWQNLNGLWEYAITDSFTTNPINFDGSILVPYPIESALSGVQKSLLPGDRLWYRRKIKIPQLRTNENVILNFGAVDWQTTLFVNKKQVGVHSGGYDSFSFDITSYLNQGANEILVKVYDPTDQGPNPHGKQALSPQNIYYTPSSGIWQTVWLENVPKSNISHLKLTPDIDNELLEIDIAATIDSQNSYLEIQATNEGSVSSTKVQLVTDNDKNKESSVKSHASLKILQAKLWSPDTPTLYDIKLKLIIDGKTVDEITSYFAMRKINIQKDEKGMDRIFLNNKYTYNLGVLDQGYWPEGIYTAPTDEALFFDIKTIKSLGFNTIRKHIKVEPERWYYYADKIGILVWQDFVNPPHNLPDGSKSIFENEVKTIIDQLYNHPSVITWVLFNERWGSYDQKRLTEWVKKYDPSRIINGHSGELLFVNNQLRAPSDSPWISSDMTDVHSYPDPRNPIAQPNKARVLGEYGGIGVSVPGHEWDDTQGWGYVQMTSKELKEQYSKMIKELKKLELLGLSASIYTQPFDVEGEENGLLTYDREIIKIPVSEIRSINKELVSQTSGFILDPNFHVATDIDLNDNDSRYSELLVIYTKGNRDSAFLRRLALMSIRKKDPERTTQIGNDYIRTLTHPFSKENLNFIKGITKTSRDKGFTMFWEHPEKIDSVLGENFARRRIMLIIDAEEISPFFKNKSSVQNWVDLQHRIKVKYGDLGEELVLGKRMLYYGYETKDWINFGKFYVLYFKKALTHPDYDINNITWDLYQNVNDITVLEFATTVMKFAINKWDQTPEAYDTYAQLLHKIKKSSEAIQWEEKALKLKKGTPDEKAYAETLQKMKAGLPTWPQNN